MEGENNRTNKKLPGKINSFRVGNGNFENSKLFEGLIILKKNTQLSCLFSLLVFSLIFSCLSSSVLSLLLHLVSSFISDLLLLLWSFFSSLIFSSSSLVFSRLLFSFLFFSFLFFSFLFFSFLFFSFLFFSCLVLSCLVYLSLSLSVSLCFCLSVSLSLSPCGGVWCLCCVVCCVVWCGVCCVLCVLVCVVCVCLWCVVVFGVWCGTQKKPPCVESKRPRVYQHHAHMCQNMRAWCRYTQGRFDSTHGGFLDGHTGREEGRERKGVTVSSTKIGPRCYHVLQRSSPKVTSGSSPLSV